MVSLHGKQSGSCEISSGVLQGSILGPLLFYLLTNIMFCAVIEFFCVLSTLRLTLAKNAVALRDIECKRQSDFLVL